MPFKEKIENNLVLFTLGLLATGFIAGFGAYKALVEVMGPGSSKFADSLTQADSLRQEDWSDLARKEDWIPQSECPAYPISLRVTSPGAGATVPFDSHTESLNSVFIVQSSRPLSASTDVGFILNEDGAPDYHVIFPQLLDNYANRTVFREDRLSIPFRPKPGGVAHMWGIAVENQTSVGAVYTNLEQIKQSAAGVFVSDKISFRLSE